MRVARMLFVAFYVVAAVGAFASRLRAEDYYSDQAWRDRRRESRTWAEKALSDDRSDVPGRRYQSYRSPRRHVQRGPEITYRNLDIGNGPRVAGWIGQASIRRDMLSGVGCFPVVEDHSAEHGSEEAAWTDAVRTWRAQVRWKYGERFADDTNAINVVRQCSRSSVNETLVGRVAEGVAKAIGSETGGTLTRCQISAEPCMAPKSYDSGTPRSDRPNGR
jgi:hypothetical protein